MNRSCSEPNVVLIGEKCYRVEKRFYGVLNFEFTDLEKDGKVYLVDGEDVSLQCGDTSIDSAIKYARHWANELEDGTFWWKVKEKES